jgi:heme A synthase
VRIARAFITHNNKNLATWKKLLIFRRCKSSQLFNKAKEIQMTHKLAALISFIVLLILTFAFAQTEAGATTGATAAGAAAAGTIAATVAAVAVTAAAVVAAVTEESKSTSTSTTTTN